MGGGSAVAWDFLTGSGEKALPGLGVTVRGPQLASHPHPLPSIKQLHLVSQITFIPPPHGCKHRSRPPPPLPPLCSIPPRGPHPKGPLRIHLPHPPKKCANPNKGFGRGEGGHPWVPWGGGAVPRSPQSCWVWGCRASGSTFCPKAASTRGQQAPTLGRWEGGIKIILNNN